MRGGGAKLAFIGFKASSPSPPSLPPYAFLLLIGNFNHKIFNPSSLTKGPLANWMSSGRWGPLLGQDGSISPSFESVMRLQNADQIIFERGGGEINKG